MTGLFLPLVLQSVSRSGWNSLSTLCFTTQTAMSLNHNQLRSYSVSHEFLITIFPPKCSLITPSSHKPHCLITSVPTIRMSKTKAALWSSSSSAPTEPITLSPSQTAARRTVEPAGWPGWQLVSRVYTALLTYNNVHTTSQLSDGSARGSPTLPPRYVGRAGAGGRRWWFQYKLFLGEGGSSGQLIERVMCGMCMMGVVAIR